MSSESVLCKSYTSAWRAHEQQCTTLQHSSQERVVSCLCS